MRAWSAALAAEVTSRPSVTTRPMFGFTALYRKTLYRKTKIFAVLPKTRGMESPNALAFKLESPGPQLARRLQRDPRIGSVDQFAKARWITFELTSAEDLHSATDWLGIAYEAAGG
jgi:predicted DNA-binding protein (MmcQ/YjbR family)